MAEKKISPLEQIAKLKQQMLKFAEDGIAQLTMDFNNLDQQIDELKNEQRKIDAQIIELGGTSLMPVLTKKTKGARTPSTVIDAIGERIVAVLDKKNAIKLADIIEKIGEDESLVKKAMAKLKLAKAIKSNGERGKAGAYLLP